MVSFEVTDTPQDVDIKTLDDGITRHGKQTVNATRHYKYVFARSKGSLNGGISGSFTGASFHIKHLWVAEDARKHGLGLELMKRIEAVARDNGCRNIFVDTMSFQAPDFYKKCGYTEVARVPNFYESHDRIFFRKDIP